MSQSLYLNIWDNKEKEFFFDFVDASCISFYKFNGDHITKPKTDKIKHAYAIGSCRGKLVIFDIDEWRFRIIKNHNLWTVSNDQRAFEREQIFLPDTKERLRSIQTPSPNTPTSVDLVFSYQRENGIGSVFYAHSSIVGERTPHLKRMIENTQEKVNEFKLIRTTKSSRAVWALLVNIYTGLCELDDRDKRDPCFMLECTELAKMCGLAKWHAQLTKYFLAELQRISFVLSWKEHK